MQVHTCARMRNWQPVVLQEAIMVIDFLTKWIIMTQKESLKIVLDEDGQVELTITNNKIMSKWGNT